jgi:hypothetical protein
MTARNDLPPKPPDAKMRADSGDRDGGVAPSGSAVGHDTVSVLERLLIPLTLVALLVSTPLLRHAQLMWGQRGVDAVLIIHRIATGSVLAVNALYIVYVLLSLLATSDRALAKFSAIFAAAGGLLPLLWAMRESVPYVISLTLLLCAVFGLSACAALTQTTRGDLRRAEATPRAGPPMVRLGQVLLAVLALLTLLRLVGALMVSRAVDTGELRLFIVGRAFFDLQRLLSVALPALWLVVSMFSRSTMKRAQRSNQALLATAGVALSIALYIFFGSAWGSVLDGWTTFGNNDLPSGFGRALPVLGAMRALWLLAGTGLTFVSWLEPKPLQQSATTLAERAEVWLPLIALGSALPEAPFFWLALVCGAFAAARRA